jgi:hypothetical protein
MLELGDFIMLNISYWLYLVVSIGMTIWVARILSKNGEVFLIKCFGQDEELAKSTNHLLVIGFYLVNVGFICFRLGGWENFAEDMIPYVGAKIGISVLVLGLMHFFNMIMIAKFGRTVSNWVRVNEVQQNMHRIPQPQQNMPHPQPPPIPTMSAHLPQTNL